MNRIILLSDVPSAEVTSDWEDISYLSDDVFIRRHADEIDCIAPEDMEEECRKINAFLSQRLGMDACQMGHKLVFDKDKTRTYLYEQYMSLRDMLKKPVDLFKYAGQADSYLHGGSLIVVVHLTPGQAPRID